MSDVPADYRDRLNLRDEIARIDRNRAESEKLQEETRKFVAEQHKLLAEAGKLNAEGRKFNRDTLLAPLLAAIALIGGVLGVASFLARFLP